MCYVVLHPAWPRYRDCLPLLQPTEHHHRHRFHGQHCEGGTSPRSEGTFLRSFRGSAAGCAWYRSCLSTLQVGLGESMLTRDGEASSAAGRLSFMLPLPPQLWDVETGTELCTLLGHTAEIVSLCFNTAGDQIITGSFDHDSKIWDVRSGRCIHTLSGHRGEVRDDNHSHSSQPPCH